MDALRSSPVEGLSCTYLLHSSCSCWCKGMHRRRPADVLKPEHKVTNTFISTCGLILLYEMWRLEGIEPSLPPIT